MLLKPRVRILVIANNCEFWKSWQDKLNQLVAFYSPVIDLVFSLQHSTFSLIPFSKYSCLGNEQDDGYFGVDPLWYNQNIASRAMGYDVVLFVIPLSQWKEPNKARGWRADADFGPIELQVGADENNKGRWGGRSYNSFFYCVAHEICHALFMLMGKTKEPDDLTHKYFYSPEPAGVLPFIKLVDQFQVPAIKRSLNYLLEILKNMIKQPSRIEDWATAIEQFESGGDKNALCYRNNNPGNLRYSPFQEGIRNGFAFFSTYKAGREALIYQLKLAAGGKSKVYKPEMTLLQFFGVYAPTIDNNHPDNYANFVAMKLGVTVTTKISKLL